MNFSKAVNRFKKGIPPLLWDPIIQPQNPIRYQALECRPLSVTLVGRSLAGGCHGGGRWPPARCLDPSSCGLQKTPREQTLGLPISLRAPKGTAVSSPAQAWGFLGTQPCLPRFALGLAGAVFPFGPEFLGKAMFGASTCWGQNSVPCMTDSVLRHPQALGPAGLSPPLPNPSGKCTSITA